MNAENEMGVVVEFSRLCEAAGWKIEAIQTAFPDVTIRNIATGETVKAEFEFMARNFAAHRHNPSGCDLIICWLNDWQECPMPIWELSNPEWIADAVVPQMDEKDRTIVRLMTETFLLKAEVAQLQLLGKGVEEARQNGVIPCRECGRVFGSQSAINAHQRKHKQKGSVKHD